MAQGERRWYTVIVLSVRDSDRLNYYDGYWVEARSTEEAREIVRADAGDFMEPIAVYIGRLKDQTENLWCKEIKEERGG